jgi:hypothetical protein
MHSRAVAIGSELQGIGIFVQISQAIGSKKSAPQFSSVLISDICVERSKSRAFPA